jgi:SAM-dependent methyltransferase
MNIKRNNLKINDDNYREGSDEVWNPLARNLWNPHLKSDRSRSSVFSEEFYLDEISPIEIVDLKDAVVLDGGCSGARSTFYSSKWSKMTIGIDLSFGGLFVARKHDQLSKFVQGDLNHLPLKYGTCDVAYSFGVLQHTPSPRTSFINLSKTLRPGGKILVWVYSREGNAFMIYFVEPLKRIFLHLFPKKFVWLLSYPVTALKWLVIHFLYLPVSRFKFLSFFRKILPKYKLLVFWGESRTFLWLFATVFDLLTAPIANYHSYDEVNEWAQGAELTDIKILDRNGSVWKVYGKKNN